MPYGDVSDVKGLAPRLNLSAGSVPNEAQVTTFIARFSAELDSALQTYGVSVPVVAPSWFVDELKSMATMAATASALFAAFPSGSGPAGVGTAADRYWQAYQARLGELRRGIGYPDVLLPVAIDGINEPRSWFTDQRSIGSYDATDEDGSYIESRPSFGREAQF